MVEDAIAGHVYRLLAGFVAKHNISVVYMPVKELTVGYIDGLFIHSDIDDAIFIDKDLPLAEKCFVLAHEFGHYVMHRRQMNAVWEKNYWSGSNSSWVVKKEAEADRFAYRLLDLAKRSVQSETGRGYCESC
ncbi:ImmA/IrrE family metallo-endopeptidase [Desulfallas thermosapovorans]|uniref:Uncharacterized protein DUF955 n=1 Tax=Desulfallas thermosapovorans DSM 6562 TaxID=1121431 RepID=A0A5S4ZNV7_9FIRM|nr:ImmA/IrrE family metallo-endopeptidase [Desulfallas thermosapovorans]TYO94519.1 uncharacterized protein DUF955 [Desulfallas thermosapovorans DSM 6562]